MKHKYHVQILRSSPDSSLFLASSAGYAFYWQFYILVLYRIFVVLNEEPTKTVHMIREFFIEIVMKYN